MRCLTCGSRVHERMKECPKCSAMIPRPEAVARATGDKTFRPMQGWGAVTSRPEARPEPREWSAGEPALPTSSPRRYGEESADVEDGENSRPAAPTAPPWTQYIVPAMIILWIAFRMFGPNIERFLAGQPWDESEAAAELELRQIVVCQRADVNGPVDVRDRFSKSGDRQVVLFTAWQGEYGQQKFSVNWHSPSDKLVAGAQKIIPTPEDPTKFILLGEMPMGEFTEAGQWRVEVLLGDAPVASHEFVIEP